MKLAGVSAGKKKMSVSDAGRQRRSFSKGDSPSASSSLFPARPRFRRDCSITSPCPSDSLARRDRCCYLAFFALSGSNEYKVGGNCRRRRQFQVSLGHQTSGGGPPGTFASGRLQTTQPPPPPVQIKPSVYRSPPIAINSHVSPLKCDRGRSIL